MSSSGFLRGAQDNLPKQTEYLFTTTSLTVDNSSKTILLSQGLPFQITISILLGLIILLQLGLITSFFLNRSKRVLEFAQPAIMNICNAAAIVITCCCYLFIYTSDAGCAVREPLIFIALTVMGATIAGRAWRISILFSPLVSLGQSGASLTENVTLIEKARQFVLQFLRGATGRRSVLFGGAQQTRLHVQISIFRIIRALCLMVLPQVLLQVIIVAVPATRSSQQAVYIYQEGEVLIGRTMCQSSMGNSWKLFPSILFTCIPFFLAWLLNMRPKNELDKLPEMVNERPGLSKTFWAFVRVVITTSPMIGMSMSPKTYVYSSICMVLTLPLCICYFISYAKLISIDKNPNLQRRVVGGAGTDGRNSVAHAVRMADMYAKIGRVEETVQLVEETLSHYRKRSGQNTIGFGGRDDGEEIGSGFTKNDLASLEPEELELIIQLLKIKGKTLITLHGHQAGSVMFAKLHVDILKIFENCPASAKLKDSSIIYPVYNYLGLQIRGGAFDQDDLCSLEVDLAEKFHFEAQVQSFHLARALANLADVYGRTGHVNEAFKYFDIMQSIYMPEHAPRLNETYAVDRCAVCIATSALWYLELGEIDAAIERCEYVAKNILPTFDKGDTIGKYHTILAVIRVLKFNNQVDRARELYDQFIPDGTENHFAVGSVHKPMSLLLKVCEGSSVKHSISDADIDLALNFEINDFSENIFTSDGWSIDSLGAELCLHLARRLKPGETTREELVKKGIHLSSLADTRVKAANGMVKHSLAYEAHREVYMDLLLLAGLDAKLPRKNIHEVGNKSWRSAATRRTMIERDSEAWSSLDESGIQRGIVSRLRFKQDTELIPSQTTAVSSGSGETLANSSERRKAPRLTHISERLFYRDSSSAKASSSGYSRGSTESKEAATGMHFRSSCTRGSAGSIDLPAIASEKSGDQDDEDVGPTKS